MVESMRRYAVVGASVLLAACATPYRMQAKFDSQAMDWAEKEGTASIEGQAFLMTVGGQPRTCAGEIVTLMPGTRYTVELSHAMTRPHTSTIVRDSNEVIRYRTALCDVRGSFKFRNLPAGRWIIHVPVRWTVVTPYEDKRQGGLLRDFLTTEEEKTTETIITR